MAKKTTTPPAETTDDPKLPPTAEELQEFHGEVHSLASTIVGAGKDVENAEKLLKERKATLKKAQLDLTAYINDDELPLLNAR